MHWSAQTVQTVFTPQTYSADICCNIMFASLRAVNVCLWNSACYWVSVANCTISNCYRFECPVTCTIVSISNDSLSGMPQYSIHSTYTTVGCCGRWGGVSSVIRVDLEGPRPHHTNSSYDSVGYIPIIHIDFLFVFLPAPCHTHTHTLSVYQYHMVVFNCLLHDIRDYGLRFGIHNL